MDEQEKTDAEQTATEEQQPPQEKAEEQKPQEKETIDEKKAVEQVQLYKRKKRNGKYLSKLDAKMLDALQRRKTLFMYLSTLMFAVSLFLKPDGRTRLAENQSLFAVFTLYVLAEVVLIVLTVYVAIVGRRGQKIGPELKEKNVPQGGLNHHTFWSYEIFNAVHIALACGEIVVSAYDFDVWGALNIVCSVASAVFCFLSRQVLFKANAGNLDFLPAREE